MNVNTTRLKRCLIAFFFLNVFHAHGQEEMIHSSGIMKLEFLNPAYNSFRNYSSVSLVSRQQWKNVVVGSPKLYAASIYAPLKPSSLGIGLVSVAEEIGLRNKFLVLGTLSHNVQTGNKSFLAFGYGLGVEHTTYDRDRIILNGDPGIFTNMDLSYHRTNISLGLFFHSSKYYIGLSTINLIDSNEDAENWLLSGFDFAIGGMYVLSKAIMFRPELEIKHYSATNIKYTDAVREVTSFNSILDLSLSFLIKNRLWLETSRRFKDAHSFSFDLVVNEKFKLGYTYEVGIGDGFNQFDSQGIRLSWNFIPVRKTKTSFSRKERYSVISAAKYLYR